VAGVQQQDARADQLVLGEGPALVDDLGEAGDEVLPRLAAAFAAEGFEADLEASFGDNVLDWDAMER
jgi:hypothetical protein